MTGQHGGVFPVRRGTHSWRPPNPAALMTIGAAAVMGPTGIIAQAPFVAVTHAASAGRTSQTRCSGSRPGGDMPSVGSLESLEHRIVLQVGGLELRIELLNERGDDEVGHLDARV